MDELLNQLLAWAINIKNQTQVEGNTSTIVGDGLERLIRAVTSLQEDKASAEDLKTLNKELQTMSIKFKGYHTTIDELNANPSTNKKDDFAWVGTPYPGTVHRVQTNGGKYIDTQEAPPLDKVDLGEYVKGDTVQQKVNESEHPISSKAVKQATTIFKENENTTGDYEDYINVLENVIGGQYVVPNASSPYSYPDYQRSDFIFVRPGDKIRITACLAYNPSAIGSNATFNGYVEPSFSSFVKPIVDLPMVGITSNGRHAIDNEEFLIPEGVNYIIGSSAVRNSGDEGRALKIELSSRGVIYDEFPVVDIVDSLSTDVSVLNKDNSVDTSVKIQLSDIEQGTFDGVGNPDGNSTRIRTKDFYTNLKFDVTNIENGYRYIIWQWNGDRFITHSGWQTEPRKWDFSNIATKIKFCFSKVNDGGISPSHFGNVGFKASAKISLREYVMSQNNDGTGGVSHTDDIISRNKEAEKAVRACQKRFVSEHNTDETTIPLFAHASDLHGDSFRLANFIKYCEHVEVDAGFVTGDIVESYFTDDFSYYKKRVLETKIPMFNTIGNHEAERGNSDDSMHEKFFKELEAQNGSISEGKGYYYRDFVNRKIRIINLNQFQQGGSYREKRYYRDNQIIWLINNLKSVPKGFGVIITSHVPEHNWKKDDNYSKFWQDKRFFGDLFSNISGSPIADIVDAFIGRTTISKEYNQGGVQSTLKVEGTFEGVDNSIEFIAYANGHLHGDFIGYLENTVYKQLVLNVVCSNAQVGNYRDGLSDLPRKPETLVEDAFNIYGIDRDMKAVKVVRIGSNITYKMEKRDFMVIPYK